MTSLDTQLDISALMEMGFSRDRVEQALNATNNRGIPVALEWLFSHPVADANSGQKLGSGDAASVVSSGDGTGKEAEDGNNTKEKAENKSENTEASATALSLKCEECGKLLKSEDEATMHASRTGHSQFAESTEAIKPLTEEEKLEQKKRLQEKLEERRRQRLEDEKEQEKLREKNRRRTGQEITKAKDEHALNEMKKLAEQRRKDKLEEKRIKQKLREQIARDRENMKTKNQTHQSKPATTVEMTPKEPSLDQPPVKKEYDVCRIQFRLMNGKQLTANFKAEDTLFTIHEYVSKNRTDGRADAFTLSTTFPRKTFIDDDMVKTLKELRLVPSTVLVLGKVI